MTTQPSSERKDNLVKILDEAERIARSVQAKAQKTVEDATSSKELAGALQDLISKQPDDSSLKPEAWEHFTSSWQAHNDQARALDKAIAAIEPQVYSATTQSSVLSTTVSVLNSSRWFPTDQSPEACRVFRIVER